MKFRLILSQIQFCIVLENMKKLLLLLILGSSQSVYSRRLSLQDYLGQVKAQSLDLKIEQTKSEALSAKALGLAIPPPMIGFSRMNAEDGSSAQGFEVSQMLPFQAILGDNLSARKYEFAAQEASRLDLRKQTFLQAKLLYIFLWQSQEKVTLLEEKKVILQEHIKISRSTARSDSLATVHLLKAESDLDNLETDIESAKQIIRERQFEMASFINLEPSSSNVSVVEPEISLIPNRVSIEESHLFKSKKLTLESFKAKEAEAKSAWFPDFNLKYKQMGATNTSMKSYEVMIGVTLPFLFFWDPYLIAKTASNETLVASYEFEKNIRNFNSAKIIHFSRLESLKKQIDILNNKLIPRATKRIRLVRNLIPRDLETLQDHRETMEALPDLKMKAIDFRIEYEKSIAELEKYISDEDSEK